MLTLFGIIITNPLQAQATLEGKITEKKSGEECIGANVAVYQNDTIVTGTHSDIDGNYKILLPAGVYDIEVSYSGFLTKRITGVEITAQKNSEVNIQFETLDIKFLEPIEVISVCIPIVEVDKTVLGKVFFSPEIRNSPTRNIKEISIIAPGVSWSQ